MAERPDLRPAIGLYPTTAIVVGAVIGSGIFVSTPGMARSSTSGAMLLGVWIAAGLLTLVGALTQCELCSSMPRTGGLYVYLHEAFGEAVGFFYGWANFTIAGSGAIAAIGFIFASYLNEFLPLWHPPPAVAGWAVNLPWLGRLYPLADLSEKGVAATLAVALTWLNTRGVKLGAGLQSLSTTLKVLALVAIVAFGFGAASGSWSHVVARPEAAPADLAKMLGLVVTALGGAFWAYDGWGNVTYVASEVKDAGRTVPRALVLGTTIVILVYLAVNAAYLYVFPLDALGKVPSDRVASALMERVAGPWGAWAVALVILLSAFDTTNSTILTNARVYFAMASERLFPKAAGSIHPRYGTPHVALWLQCAWTLVLLATGSFDLIASMYVWVNWLFYLLMAIAVFVCRRRGMPRKFTIRGYPYLPATFVVFTTIYLVMTLVEDVRAFRAGEAPCIKSVMGLLLVLSGAPLYWGMARRRSRALATHATSSTTV